MITDYVLVPYGVNCVATIADITASLSSILERAQRSSVEPIRAYCGCHPNVGEAMLVRMYSSSADWLEGGIAFSPSAMEFANSLRLPIGSRMLPLHIERPTGEIVRDWTLLTMPMVYFGPDDPLDIGDVDLQLAHLDSRTPSPPRCYNVEFLVSPCAARRLGQSNAIGLRAKGFRGNTLSFNPLGSRPHVIRPVLRHRPIGRARRVPDDALWKKVRAIAIRIWKRAERGTASGESSLFLRTFDSELNAIGNAAGAKRVEEVLQQANLTMPQGLVDFFSNCSDTLRLRYRFNEGMGIAAGVMAEWNTYDPAGHGEGRLLRVSGGRPTLIPPTSIEVDISLETIGEFVADFHSWKCDSFPGPVFGDGLEWSRWPHDMMFPFQGDLSDGLFLVTDGPDEGCVSMYAEGKMEFVHGAVLAESFAEFLDSWSSLGFVKPDNYGLWPFYDRVNERLDAKTPLARKLQKWLGIDDLVD